MSGLLTSPLILSLSKDEPKGESPDREGWFDKLTMSGFQSLHQAGGRGKGQSTRCHSPKPPGGL